MRRPVLFALTGAGLLVITGCTSVPKPTADTTPPVLTWHVENRTQETTTTVTNSGTVTGAKNDDFRVTLTADDPQGVHKIGLAGGFDERCETSNGSVGRSSQGDFAPQTQTLQPDAGDKVPTSGFLIMTVNHSTDCTDKLDWKSTVVSLDGTAMNYVNGTVTGSLTISEKA